VAKALEKLPADRWQSTAEFTEALAKADAGFAARRSSSRWNVVPWLIAALALGWAGYHSTRQHTCRRHRFVSRLISIAA
jgi:hypothetical protein